ncbi:MAG: tRNA (guanine-N(1)-)-methyltransferase [Microgenomates group bacterium GW2011_GWA1_48_10]|nr:MAG: tRNA (guanine-N(1)-)-methyltransferase [Microgenomates group bacterium GW2011_GWA1_48_10]
MIIDIITLFPEMFSGPFDQSIIKRAQDKGLATIRLHDLREFAIDERGTVDDRPYGGGVGMILRVEPIYRALQKIRNKQSNTKIILMDPRGTKFTQQMARDYTGLDQLILICGRYEGVDERVREYLVDEAVSVGDYVLTGGEIPAMVISDAVIRLLPGVLEKPGATDIETFSNIAPALSTVEGPQQYLEYPQYTRPEEFNGWKVPEVLLSGNHEAIRIWRQPIKR